MTPDLRQRVFAAVAAEPSPTRTEARRTRRLLLAGAGTVSLLIFWYTGGAHPSGRPLGLWAATALGATAIAAGALVLALGRGRSMLGRSAALLLGLALLTPLFLVAWKYSLSSEFGMTAPIDGRPGFRCLGLALATGIAPIVAFLHIWRRTSPAHPRLTGLALGTSAGAVAWVVVDLWCPIAHFHHLLLGHVLPLVVLAGIGAAAGGLLAPRGAGTGSR